MDTRAQAHDAFGRRDWQAAYDAFGACAELDAGDYDAYAESAHWLGLPDETIASYREAYRRHLCVYVAENEAAVREHAVKGGFPANSVSRVATMIDPASGE